MAFLSKYGVARHIYIAIPKAGSASHAVGADWTPAAGDVRISKDGGATANVTNLPTAIAMGNSAIWDFSLTLTEMSAAQIMVTIADSATKAVDDTGFIIETFGNASALFPFDLGTALSGQTLGTLTTYTGNTPQTGDAYARLGAPAGASASADIAAVKAVLPSALTSNGRMKSSLEAILDTAFTEGAAGRIAAAFKQFFNIASPAATMDHGILTDTTTTLTNAPSDSSGVTTLLSRVPSGIFTGITSLAQWLGLIAGKQTGNTTARTELRATGGGSGTFDETTDSQEAIRDNMGTAQTGDAYARLGAPAGASVSADVAAVKADTGNLVTRITSTLFSGITSMAHWLGALAGKQAANATAQTEIRASGAGSGTFDPTTDSQEAIRDRGDAAWVTGTTPPTAAAVADAVWEETLSDHSGTAGSTAAALNAAGSAGDPWSTALPGAYGSGTAGKILGDNLNATVSSRATQVSVDDIPTNAELATALASADDAVLAAIAALNNLSQANIRTAIGLATANLDTQLDALPTNAELATALAAADDAVLAAIAALNNLSQANIRTAVGLGSANLDTQLDALPTNAELATALAAADDAVLAAIAALNNLSAAQVNAQVVDALLTDTYAEPAAVPAATASLVEKIGWLTALARNKVTQTATTQTLRNDADSGSIATAAVSDDNTTFIRNEWA